MAKVGEGDPRWIVSERQDGSNVNSWHWEERDLSKITHDDLKNIFGGMELTKEWSSAEVAALKMEELSDISGDVTVAQRKGKMMCYFELKMTLKWVGTSVDGAEVKGKMEVPEVDHDELTNDYDITVTCQENTAAAQQMEEIMRRQGRTLVRRTIQDYFEKLFAEYHIGQAVKSGAAMPPLPATKKPVENKTSTTSSKSNNTESGEATSFSWKMKWRAPAEELFGALTDERRASVYTRSPATIDAKAGGQFSFLGGVISGYYVEVNEPTLIRQQWRLGSWPVGVHSSVVMQLVKEEPGVTVLEFAQSGIPAGQLQSVKEGWRANFFEAIKMVFGYSLEYL